MLTARDPNLQRLAGEICARPGGATTRDHALATLLEAAWDCLEYDDVGHCLRFGVRTPQGTTLRHTQECRHAPRRWALPRRCDCAG